MRAGRGGNHPAEVESRRAGANRPKPGHAAVRDTDGFERLLGRLVADAREHGVSTEGVWRALRRHADEAADPPNPGETTESAD